MPPTNRPIRDDRPNLRRPNPINNNNNNPPANIVYSIVSQSQPPPPTQFKPPPETEDRNLRRINREARMKANRERRNNRQLQTKPNVFLPPPDNDKKIDAIPPPIDNLKTPEDNVKKIYGNPFPKGTGNNPQFLLLTGGSLLVVGLIIAMNKR